MSVSIAESAAALIHSIQYHPASIDLSCVASDVIVCPIGADQYNALHWAAHCNEADVLHALLKRCLSQSDALTSRTHSGATPLFVAASRGCVRACQALLDHGASISDRNRWQESAFHSAAGNGHAEIVTLFLQHRRNVSPAVDFLNETDRWGRSPLRIAIENSCTNIRVLLETEGALNLGQSNDINTDTAQTMLNSGVVDEFLRKVADRRIVNESSNDNTTTSVQSASSAVTTSAQASTVPVKSNAIASPAVVLSRVIEYGCTVEFVREFLHKPASVAQVCGRDSFGMSAFLKFVAWDSTEHLQLLLHFCRQNDAESALITAVEPKTLRSALHIGFSENAWRAVQFLLSDTSIRTTLLAMTDAKGRTALETAKLECIAIPAEISELLASS